MKFYRILLFSFSLLFCALHLSAAVETDAAVKIEKAVKLQTLQAAEGQAKQDKAFVSLSKDKQFKFDKLFAQAVEAIDECGLEKYDLGMALESWLPESMIYAKETADPTADEVPVLTDSEERAALYAVSVLIPAQYREDSRYNEQYIKEHPVTDWEQYRKDCAWALDLLYESIEAIATREPNFQFSILKSLTH